MAKEFDDEYKLMPLLLGTPNPLQLARTIHDHLDRILTVYLEDRKEARDAMATEYNVCLHMALMQCKEYDSLRERVMDIANTHRG